MTETLRVLARATDDEPLISRALAAWHRSPESHSHGTVLPSSSSYLCESGGKQYVVLLTDAGGVLAVYRVRNNGVLKGLRRWPAEIEVKP